MLPTFMHLYKYTTGAWKHGRGLGELPPSPVHKLLDSFSATLGFSGNFQLIEQLSVHRTTFTFLCLDSHSHVSGTSEKTKKCRIQLVSRRYLCNHLALMLGSTCSMKECLDESRGYSNATIKKLTRNTGRLSFKRKLEKTGIVAEIFYQTRIHRTPPIKCFTKPGHFISCVS